MKNITMIGFGSWGIALACLLDRNGHKVAAWDSNADYVGRLAVSRQNEYLPGVVIPQSICITSDAAVAAKTADIFVFALPSKGLGVIPQLFAGFFKPGVVIVSVSKGFDEGSQARICEYLQGHAPGCAVVALTGPSHAEEVIKGVPTAVVAASACEAAAETVQHVFSTDTFRVYTSTDVIGVELGGAIKNVIALAAGCSDGLGLGDNTKAALITRGIAEITRLGVAMGAKEQTFGGLSGIGDLIVTCTSQHSRNWRAGYLLAKGKGLGEVLAEVGMVVEGAATAETALQLARKFNVEMPIVEEINNVLFAGKTPDEAVRDLMLRGMKDEYYSRSIHTRG
ncbi:MAG: NAD(P)-dependent glycerol-3-phosphate dehydrogenase [Defluviitaleaceae bacterium]|nr:NAD(P)-dependent glycerol-3-phosphate dehydrogenase [Defluviitaleaceae bacterium]